MYTVGKTYLMWLLSLIIPGAHRFYLGKIGSGILYLLTGGVCFIGTFVDLFNIPRLVREANYRIAFERALLNDPLAVSVPHQKPKKESIERVILKAAKVHNGVVTPSEVALEGDITIVEAKKYLDQLAVKGFAEMRIKTNGVIVYIFSDFLKETKEAGYEDI